MTAKNQNTNDQGIPLKVLILEDQAADAELMLRELRKAGYQPTWQRVETESDFQSALNDSPDLILADLNLPQLSGRKTIDILKQSGCNVPLIITGTLADTSLEYLQQGAVDHLLEDRIGRLGPAVKKVLEGKLIRGNKELPVAALRASDEPYRRIAEASSAGISILDADGIITYSNPALSEISGYTTRELRGMPLARFIDPDEYLRIQIETEKHKQGLASNYETKITREDDESRTVIVSAIPLLDENREYQGSLATITDITERKDAEYKLQHLNLVLQTIRKINHLLLECNNQDDLIREACRILTDNRGYHRAWIVLFDDKGNYLQSSGSGLGDEFEPLRRRLEDGWLPYCGTKAIHHKKLVCIDDPPNRCGDCPLANQYEHWGGFATLLKYDNKLYGLLMAATPSPLMDLKEEWDLFNEIGDDIGFALHNIGIEETSKSDKAALRLQSLALESAANGIVITDAAGDIQWANPAFSTLTGYPLADVIGKNPRFLKSGQQGRKFYKNLWDTISSGEVWQGEIVNKRADGSLYTEEMTISPLLSDSNKISNYIAIKQDVSDRVRVQTEIRQRTKDLILINAINAAVNRGHDLPDILDLLARESKRVFDCNAATVYLYSEDEEFLEMQNLNLSPSIAKQIEKLVGVNLSEIRIPVRDGSVTQELLFAEGPRIINDTEKIQKWMVEFTYALDLPERSRIRIQKLIPKIYDLVGVRSVMSVPMRSADKLIGLVDISRREPFSEEDSNRIAGIVGQVTAAITSLRAEEEKVHNRNLLLSLSQAAPVVQQANSAADIYRAIGEEVKKIGYDVTVFTLQDDEKRLAVVYHTLSDLAQKIENLTGLSSVNYSFPLKPGGFFHKIIREGKAIFSRFEIEPIAETLPRLVQPLAGRIMEFFGSQQSIIAPLAIRGEVYGLLAISGPELTSSDIPAVTIFANQAAIALEKTRLFDEAEALGAFNEGIVQSMAEGIVVEDLEGMIIFTNPAARSMLGYPAEDCVGKHWTDIVPVDQQPIVQEADERRKDGKADQYELELTRQDGRRISVLVSGSPRFNKEGQLIGTMAVFADITDRKQAEERVSRFSRIFEDSLNEIYLFDPETLKFTQVNAAGQDNLGYSMEELSELTPLDIEPELTAESFEYLIAPLLTNETERVVLETVHKRKDGSLYYVEAHIQLLRYADGSLFAAIVLDVTGRYQAELENKRYIRRLDALLKIDQAIMGSFDLQVTLKVILEQATTELAVDAVAVLIYQAELQALTFAQSYGFHTPAIRYTNLRLGEGYAGQAGLQREHVFIPDLNLALGKFKDSLHFSEEGFVSYYGVPLIAKGKLVGVLEIYHRSPLDPGDEWVNYLKILAGQIAIAIDDISLFNELQRTNVDLSLAYDATIEGWAHALELKDTETEGHSRRVVEMTLDLARKMGISGENLAHLRRGALLHDIGKMGVPDSILSKPGKLTDDEWEIMRQHPVYAYNWLSRIQYLVPALDIPYAHHERWDGTGYPRGLAGEQIPLAARIFAIVDVWDALNSDRPYRKAWPKEKIMVHIREQSGKHFDPEVVEKFLELVENNEINQE